MTAQVRILHIARRTDPETARFNAVLKQSRQPCDQVPDCYAALARLVRGGTAPYDLILASLDGWSAAEVEFFELTARRFRSTSIYVYGGSASALGVPQALAGGARAEVDCAAWRLVLSDMTARRRPAESRLETTRLTDLLVDELVGPLGERPRPDLSEAEFADGGEADDLGEAVDESTPDGEATSLLSPDELQALLGDSGAANGGS